MGADKLVDSVKLNNDLTSIANAIRTKGGTSVQLVFPSGFVSAIGNISTTFSQADEGKVVSNGALVAQSSQNITENGTYDTTLKNEVVVDVSGGSSAISLLDTITVSANTRAVNLDLTPYSSYDFVSVFFDEVNIGPSGDWVYFVRNGSSTSGGTYTNKQATFTGLVAILCHWAGAGFKFCSNVTSNSLSTNSQNESAVTNLYMYCYTSSCYFTAGSTIKIYGGNYADL